MPHDGDYRTTDEIRTDAQNRIFHALIRDISEQVVWANGHMTEEQWKLLTMGSAHGQEIVPNIFDPQAGFVVVNKRRSSGLVIPEMADVITQLIAFGNERGVKWRKE